MNNLGYCLFRAGEYEEAVCRLRQSLAAGPDNAMAHANLVATMNAAGQGLEAIPYRRRLCELRPDTVEYPFDLANALLGCGRVEEALTYYQRALAVDPNHSAAAFNYLLALNYSERRTPEEVLAEHVRVAARWAGRAPPRCSPSPATRTESCASATCRPTSPSTRSAS